MLSVLKKTYIPLLSLFIFAMGSGFFITLITYAMHYRHALPLTIGAMSGMYYLGLMCGAFRIEPLFLELVTSEPLQHFHQLSPWLAFCMA